MKADTVRAMRTVQTPEEMQVRRGLGWDIDSPYAGPRGDHLPVGSFGHTGWTGTSLWIDPFSQTFVIFMSNRNHPDESGSVLQLRNRIGTLAAEAVRDFLYARMRGVKDHPASPTRSPRPANAPVDHDLAATLRDIANELRLLRESLPANRPLTPPDTHHV